MPHPIRKKIEAFQWLGFTLEERFKRNLPVTQEEYAEKNQVSTRQLSNWKAEYDKVQSEKYHIEAEEDSGDYDSAAWLLTRTPNADKALLKAMQGGSPAALKLFYQLLDRLTEKSEHKVKLELNADEITRRNLEAERQLREGGYGMAKVPNELPVFSQDIRENTGQE